MFAALMIGDHFSISAFCNAPSASGVYRTLSPAVDLFIACARETAKALAFRPQSGKA
jgi:hypothetical protein